MKKSFTAWTLFLFCTVGASSLLWSQSQQPRRPTQKQKQFEEKEDQPKGQAALRVNVDQVQVNVTVQDKHRNLIEGLKPANFKVYEDKVLQKVTNFHPIEAPMTVVLLVEYSRVLPWEMLYEAWLASNVFVQQMRSDDWVAVVAYDLKPEILVDFTQNKGDVSQALRRLNYPGFRESNLYDALYDTLDRLEEVDGKVAVVLVSSGLDTFSKHNLDQTFKKVKKSGVVIYTVSLGGNLRARAEQRLDTYTRMSFYQGDAALKEFSKLTGGFSYFPRFTQEFPNIFRNISTLLRHQYSLGYVSTNTKRDGKFRKIKVEVNADIDGDGKPDKLKVSYRNGYLAPIGG